MGHGYRYKPIACRSDSEAKSPVTDWFEAQDAKTQAKFLWVFDLLEESGIDVGMPHIKPLEDKLYEIRIRVDRNAYRIIYFLHTGQKFILGSPSHRVISFAYLNNFRAAPIIQISITYHPMRRRAKYIWRNISSHKNI